MGGGRGRAGRCRRLWVSCGSNMAAPPPCTPHHLVGDTCISSAKVRGEGRRFNALRRHPNKPFSAPPPTLPILLAAGVTWHCPARHRDECHAPRCLTPPHGASRLGKHTLRPSLKPASVTTHTRPIDRPFHLAHSEVALPVTSRPLWRHAADSQWPGGSLECTRLPLDALSRWECRR